SSRLHVITGDDRPSANRLSAFACGFNHRPKGIHHGQIPDRHLHQLDTEIPSPLGCLHRLPGGQATQHRHEPMPLEDGLEADHGRLRDGWRLTSWATRLLACCCSGVAVAELSTTTCGTEGRKSTSMLAR